MGHKFNIKKERLSLTQYALLGVIIASMVIRLFIVFQPMDILLGNYLADDAFYYLQVALNISSGNGIVYNHNIPTSGFHPLYTILLIPIVEILYLTSIEAPIRGALVLLLLFDIVTSISIFAIISYLFDRFEAVLLSGLWLLHPSVISRSLHGMETTIQVTFIALSTFMILKREDMGDKYFSILLGALLGLAFLARLDSAIFAICVYGALIRRAIVSDRNSSLSSLAIIPSTALVISLPWFIWNFSQFGRLTPTSFDAVRRIFTSVSDPAIAARQLTNNLFDIIFPYLHVNSFMGIVIGFMIILSLSTKFGEYTNREIVLNLDYLFAYTLLTTIFYVFYIQRIRPWYFTTFYFLWLIIIFIFLSNIVSGISDEDQLISNIVRVVIVLLVISALIGTAGGLIVENRDNNLVNKKLLWHEQAQYINNNIPDGEPVANHATGVLQYFTPRNDVHNLDGVMNPEANQAVQSGQLTSYYIRHDIQYTFTYTDEMAANNSITAERVKSFPYRQNSFVLYRLSYEAPTE